MKSVAPTPPHPKRDAIRARLLGWYDAHARSLPWRTGPQAIGAGARHDPYRVWLSEIMLQQTTTPHAAPYFRAFTERWPKVNDLAAEKDEVVMAAWAGLGYYARARNLLACARAVAGEHGGVFPDTEEGLRALPGIGAYTAAAVAAIAFERTANVVDGNVERVMSRLFAVETPLPATKTELARLAGSLVGAKRPGDWAQALMDLGATVCTPKSPKCLVCPLTADCAAFARGDPQTFPRKTKKAERPHRYGIAYVVRRNGEIALTLRPAKGLLGGMLGLPTSDWAADEPAPMPPTQAAWRDVGSIEHVFTHFSLSLRVLAAETTSEVSDAVWRSYAEARAALPTVFRKALGRALG